MTNELSATDIKFKGNKLFCDGKYKQALEMYKKAIEMDPTVAIFYSNAATCYSRLGNHEKALEMINEAIRLDPTFIKALYRRGVALMELKRFNEATEDFIRVCQEFPSDVEAQRRLKACDKETDRVISFEESMRQGFSEAIKVERFELTRKCVEAMTVDSTYSGPTISFDEPLTPEWVKDVLIPYFEADKRLHRKYAYMLLLLAKETFEKEPSLIEVGVEEDEMVTICGDVHGQFFDMLEIFKKNGYPSAKHKYLFNGDIVDRGAYSVECLLTFCAFKAACPQSFFVSRGNHESEPINRVHGFYDECFRKYQNHQFFSMANLMLNSLPIAYVVGKELFVVHGGLPGKADFMLEDVRSINRFRIPESGSLLSQLLWSDPHEAPGIGPSHRGEGVHFGPDVTAAFLERNNLKKVIRSHVWKSQGYEVEQGGLCITIFSAPNYTGMTGMGAWINVKSDMKLEFIQFGAAEYQGKYEKPRPNPAIQGGWY